MIENTDSTWPTQSDGWPSLWWLGQRSRVFRRLHRWAVAHTSSKTTEPPDAAIKA
jgi:hypothetical protein